MSKTPSPQAEAAKQIRRDLKAAFPSVAFKVTSCGFAGGNAVDITWTDGPTTAQVDRLTGRYQEGRFDGMIDLYEYTNTRRDIPQVKYVQTQRDHSDAATAAAVAVVNRERGWDLGYEPNAYGRMAITNDALRGNCSGWQSHDIYRELQAWSQGCTACGWSDTLPGDNYCPTCGHDLRPSDDEETNVSLATVDWEATVNTL